VNQAVKVVFATAAAICVLTVLITPAFDELPSTVPHIFHETIALPIAIGPYLLRITSATPQPDATAARILSGADLLSLTCTRLC